MKQINILLIATLAISIFFRFYRNDELQYWNNDEEVHAWTVQRMIVLKRPALVSPQPTLGTSIGSFFHIASVPLFLIAGMDPRRIAEIFSVVGLGTTAVIYLLGKEVTNRRTGLIAAFLYAASFMASLYDRRWWPITLTPLLSGLALLLVIRMVKERNGKLLPPVVLIAGSAFHGDPAMLAIGAFTTVVLFLYRIPVSLRAMLFSSLIVFVLISPLLLFEWKHPGAIMSPIVKHFSENSAPMMTDASKALLETFATFGETVRLLFIPVSSPLLESWFFPRQVLPWTAQNVVFAILFSSVVLSPLVLSFFKKEKKLLGMQLISIFTSLCMFSALLFAVAYHHQFQRVYLTLLFPAIFVSAGWVLKKSLVGKDCLLALVLIAYMLINWFALNNSRLRYSLPLRWDVVQATLPYLTSGKFSFYAVGDSWLEVSGVTNLYTMAGFIPKKSYIYGPLDWLLRSHSLYFIEPTKEEGRRIVLMAPAGYELPKAHAIYSHTIDTMEVMVYDNSNQWFDEKRLQESPSN